MSTPLQVRVAQLVRLLSSDKVGEAGAAQALIRAVNGIGIDVHQFADLVVAALEPPAKTDDDNDWIPVDSYTSSYHHKPGGKPGLRICYRCGTARYFDFWAIQHDGLAYEIAAQKWTDLAGNLPAPETVDEALDRIDELSSDIEISIRHDGHYWQVIGQRVRRMGAAS